MEYARDTGDFMGVKYGKLPLYLFFSIWSPIEIYVKYVVYMVVDAFRW